MGTSRTASRGRIVFASLAAVLALTATACSSSSKGGSSGSGSSGGTSSGSGGGSTKAIKVGFVGTLSGPTATPAVLQEHALQVWTDATNKSGGILGRKISVKYVDDGGSAAKAAQAVRQLTSDGAQILFGPVLYPESVQPLEAQKNFVQFVLYPDPTLSDPTKYPYTFNFYPPAGEDGVVQIAAYTVAHGQSKWATIADTSQSDQAIQTEFSKDAKKYNATIATKINFDASTLDFSAIVTKIKNSGATAVTLSSLGPAVPAFLTAMKTAGLNLPVYGNATLAFADLSQVPPSALANTYVVLPKGSVLQNGAPIVGYQALSKAIYARFGNASITGSGIPQQLDMFEAMKYAVEKAGGTDPTKVRQALETQVTNKSFLGGAGITYTITAASHEAFPSDPAALSIVHIQPDKTWPGYHAPVSG